MPSTRKKGNKYYARWYRPDGRQAEKGGFDDAKSAMQFAKSMEVDIKRKKYIDPIDSNITLFEYIDTIWKHTLNVEDETKVGYQYKINKHILPYLGNLPLHKISPSTIKTWLAQLNNLESSGKAPLSAKYIESIANQLGSILRAAVDDKFLVDSPMSRVKRKKAIRVNKVIPLEYEVVEAIANSMSPKFRAIVWTGYYTAMRPSEILGLSIRQIDFENGRILIDQQISRNPNEITKKTLKTRKSFREIGLPQELKAVLEEHIHQFGLGPEGLIFQNRDGKEMRYKNACNLFREHSRKFGVPRGTNLHVLRHTCVSTLIREGAQQKEIQELCGHESIMETMDTYGHLFPSKAGSLAAKMDQAARKARSEKKQEMVLVS
jgi:integrase